MKRRSFLTMLGLAPVVATVPAVAKTNDVDRTGDFSVNAGRFRSRDGSFTIDIANGTIVLWE